MVNVADKLMVNGVEVIKIHANTNSVVYVLDRPVDLAQVEVDVAISPGK